MPTKMAASSSPEPATLKSDKKHKKDKSSKSEKKRAREEDAPADASHKRKKSKSVNVDDDDEVAVNGDGEDKKKKKKDKKSKRSEEVVEEEDALAVEDVKAEKKKKHKRKQKAAEDAAASDDGADAVDATEEKESKKKHKKKKKEKQEEPVEEAEEEADKVEVKKKKKKSKKQREMDDAETKPEAEEDAQMELMPSAKDPEAMDMDKPSQPSKMYQPPDIPANPQFPFFSQTVSLYEPIYPVGWAQPVTNCQYQHLHHLQNRYVPSLRGVLMDYKNVSLGENPGREGAAMDDEAMSMLKSQNEFGGAFGWITADVELFVPSRGAWMEGSVNLQTEGHIGVVCFSKFNASIEARRLPSSWKWVSNDTPDAMGMEETASLFTADDHGVVRQVHSTGFWADGNGDKIKGTIRFRIRNFDAGMSGETSYLSLEGTMLDSAGEKRLVKDEARIAQMRRQTKGGQRAERKRAPDFSMTRFAADEEEEQADVMEVEEPKAETETTGEVPKEE